MLSTLHHLRKAQRMIRKIKRESRIKINLGCGDDFLKGYLNCDRYNNCADISLDMHELPFLDESIDLIETHHALEHLPMEKADKAISECYRVLKHKGHLIISVPNLEECLKLLLRKSSKNKLDHIIKMIYGSQENEGMFHRCGFTPQILSQLLELTGFKILLLKDGIPKRPTPSFLCIAGKATK